LTRFAAWAELSKLTLVIIYFCRLLKDMLSRLCFFALSFVLLTRASAEEIRIAASDLLAGCIAAPLAAYGEAQAIDCKLDNIGSLPALERLRANETDLAIIAVPANAEIPSEEFRVYSFAYDIAVLAVDRLHPMDQISLQELGGIFGANEELNYNSWGDVGLSALGSRSIKPLTALLDGSISLELFKFSVLREGQLKASVAAVEDSEVEGLLRSDPSTIAVLSRLPKSKTSKALMISDKLGGAAFGPTEDNVHYGDYPLRLAFYLAYHERNHTKLQNVLGFLLSDQIADALRAHHLVALPSPVRRQLSIELEQ
jgi:ABC-type phosphate transport system substrate-binding protein